MTGNLWNRFAPNHSSVTWIWFIEKRLLFWISSPVEIGTINDHSTDDSTMPPDVFRQRMYHDRSSVLNRVTDDRGRSVVDDKRNIVFSANV